MNEGYEYVWTDLAADARDGHKRAQQGADRDYDIDAAATWTHMRLREALEYVKGQGGPKTWSRKIV